MPFTEEPLKAKCYNYYHGESFPFVEINDDDETIHYATCDETEYLCFQPSYLDDKEFNLIILFNDRPVLVRSSHFTFNY